MEYLIDLQRWLYGGLSSGMKSTDDMSGLPALVGAAFIFGMVHALMPGHGKSVLVSYHAGRDGRPIDGLITGSLLAFTHVGIALVLVLAGVAVISRTIAAGGRAPAFEAASAAMITVVGLYLAARALWPPPHTRTANGKALAVATGLVPCPLTTFILIYALANEKLAVGLAAVVAMLGGVIVTLSTFAIAAVLARDWISQALNLHEAFRFRLGFWIELCAALTVVALGSAMLIRTVL